MQGSPRYIYYMETQRNKGNESMTINSIDIKSMYIIYDIARTM